MLSGISGPIKDRDYGCQNASAVVNFLDVDAQLLTNPSVKTEANLVASVNNRGKQDCRYGATRFAQLVRRKRISKEVKATCSHKSFEVKLPE